MTERKTFWAWTAATFFGAGLGKPGPGTWGSVAAVLLWSAAGKFFGLEGNTLLWATIAASVLVTVIGIPAATIVAAESGKEDPGHVVIDEVAGQWITLIGSAVSWRHALLGLALFRLFDIFKPWPVRELEKLPRGWGIVFDDVAAGVLGLIVATFLHKWI